MAGAFRPRGNDRRGFKGGFSIAFIQKKLLQALLALGPEATWEVGLGRI